MTSEQLFVLLKEEYGEGPAVKVLNSRFDSPFYDGIKILSCLSRVSIPPEISLGSVLKCKQEGLGVHVIRGGEQHVILWISKNFAHIHLKQLREPPHRRDLKRASVIGRPAYGEPRKQNLHLGQPYVILP